MRYNRMMQQAELGRLTVNYLNRAEFLDLKREIWTGGRYYADLSEIERPLLIDVGAHLGMTTLYWANLYPTAQILALEPNPLLYPLLEENINQNGLENRTTTLEAAASNQNGRQAFHFDQLDNDEEKWLLSGSLYPGAWNGQQSTTTVMVETVRLSEVLTDFLDRQAAKQIDLLKLDIEGEEMVVLRDLRPLLPRIKQLMIEYHPTGQQSLTTIRKWLSQAGFEVELSVIETGRPYQFKVNQEPKELLFITADRDVE